MAGLFGGGLGSDPTDAAQDIMYEAWEATSRSKRISLARKALKVSPLCADAYVLLAEEEAGSVEEVLDCYQKGVAAGEEALGPDGFEEYAGRFWGFSRRAPTCGRGQVLPPYSGGLVSIRRPLTIIRQCSSSIRTTIRASATCWPGICWRATISRP